MKDRQRIALIVGGVLVVVVVVAVALFGLVSPPAFRDLIDDPATEAPGTLAYTTTDPAGERTCVHVVPATGGEPPREVLCRSAYLDVGWSPNGTLALWSEGQVAQIVDPDTGEVIREEVVDVDDTVYPTYNAQGLRTFDEDRRVRLTAEVDGEAVELLDEPAPDDYWIGQTMRSDDGRWVVAVDSEERLLLFDVTGEVEPGVIATGVGWDLSWSEQPGR